MILTKQLILKLFIQMSGLIRVWTFSELIIKTKRIDQYDFMESLLLKEISGQILPAFTFSVTEGYHYRTSFSKN